MRIFVFLEGMGFEEFRHLFFFEKKIKKRTRIGVCGKSPSEKIGKRKKEIKVGFHESPETIYLLICGAALYDQNQSTKKQMKRKKN